MLTAYLNQTKRLLQNPGAPTSLYSDADLTAWINIARGQIAGEGECIRTWGQQACSVGRSGYYFSAMSLNVAPSGAPGSPFSALSAIAGVIHVRSVMRSSGAGGLGLRWLVPRPFEWYQLYGQNNDVLTNAPPEYWAQFNQGAGYASGSPSSTGSFYLFPYPDDTYILTCDCVCFPVDLVTDATAEAIPYLWTDAVPYFAAYLAFLSAQTGARQADADRMFTHYQTFMQRARQFANPAPDRWVYQQAAATEGVNPLAQQSGGQR